MTLRPLALTLVVLALLSPALLRADSGSMKRASIADANNGHTVLQCHYETRPHEDNEFLPR